MDILGREADNVILGDFTVTGDLLVEGKSTVTGSTTFTSVVSDDIKNSGNSFQVDASGNLVCNDMTVNGTTTTVNSTTVTIDDPIIHVSEGAVNDLKNSGIMAEYNDGATKYRGVVFDRASQQWKTTNGHLSVIPESSAIADGNLAPIKSSDFITATDSLSQIRIDIGTLGSTTDIVIGDNATDAFQIREAANKYISVNSTDFNEKIILHKNTDISGNVAVTGTVDNRDISADGSKLDLLHDTIGLSTLTAAEATQIKNIDATTISTTQWGYLGASDQGTATTDGVTFASITTPGTVDGRDISVDGSKLDLLHDTIGLSTLTAAEATQIKNIDAVTISNTQWGYLGSQNQSLSTSDTASFANINTSGTVDGVDISTFKSDYDSKIDQDLRTTASPSFIKATLDDGATDNTRINTDSASITGSQNILIQSGAKNSLGALSSGSFNVAVVSNSSANTLSSGQYNTLIGSNVAPNLSSGSNNISIGATSNANTTTVDGTISIGSTSDCSNFVNTIAIGNNAKINHASCIALGAGASTSAANQLTIGDGSSSITQIVPTTTSVCDLGTASKKFKDINISGNINVDGTVDGVDVNAQATAQNAHIADLSIHRQLNDATTSTTTLWSSSKISDELKTAAEGLHAKDGMRVKTTVAFNSYTFSSGVITSTANELIQVQDGVTLALNDRVLVTTEATTSDVHNGLYYVTALGQAGVSQWQLTRTTDGDEPNEIDNHTFCFIEEGSVYANTGWLQSESGTITINTDPINFVQFSSAGIITASNVGSGAGKVFKTKNGNDLRFKSIASGSSKLSVTNGTDDVSLDVVQANITGTGALDSGSITSNFGSINNGTSGISSGTLTAGNLSMNSVGNLFRFAANSFIDFPANQALALQMVDSLGAPFIQFDTQVSAPRCVFGQNIDMGVKNIITSGLVDGRDVSADGATLDGLGTSGITGLTAAEVAQLANIDSTTISTTQWGYLGASDQGIASTDTVTFANIITSGNVDGRDVSADGAKLDLLHDTIGLSALTSAEVDQLENIGTTTISAPQWNILGSANQASTTSGSSVSHTNVTLTGSLISGSASLNSVDLLKLDAVTDGTVSANKCVIVDSNKDLTGTRKNVMQQLDLSLGASEYCIAPSNTLGAANNVAALQFGSSNTRGFHFYTSSLKFCSDLEGPVGGAGTWTTPVLKIQNDKIAINSGNDETITAPEQLQVTGNVSFTGFVKKTVTTVNQAAYSVAITDHVVVQTYTVAVSTITLGDITNYPVGAEIMVRRGATGKTLTIAPFAGQQINGSASSITENSDWGGYRFTKYTNVTWLACQCV